MSNLDTFLEFKVFLNLFPLNNFAQLLKGISKNLRLKKFNLPIPCLNAKIVQNLWVTVPTYLSSHTYVKKTRKHSILQKFMKQTESRTRIAIYFWKWYMPLHEKMPVVCQFQIYFIHCTYATYANVVKVAKKGLQQQ